MKDFILPRDHYHKSDLYICHKYLKSKGENIDFSQNLYLRHRSIMLDLGRLTPTLR